MLRHRNVASWVSLGDLRQRGYWSVVMRERWETLQSVVDRCQALMAVLRCFDFYHDSCGQPLRYFKQGRVMVGYRLTYSFSKHKNKQFYVTFNFQINENLQD